MTEFPRHLWYGAVLSANQALAGINGCPHIVRFAQPATRRCPLGLAGNVVVLTILTTHLDQRVAQHKHIHPRSEETIERFLRLAHNGLILVERRVQDHRHPRQSPERLDQAIIARVRLAMHGLDARRVVHMRHRRNIGPWDV